MKHNIIRRQFLKNEAVGLMAVNALGFLPYEKVFAATFAVKDGKYADFLLLNKDVLTCPETEIHTARPAATYFEGKKVFSM